MVKYETGFFLFAWRRGEEKKKTNGQCLAPISYLLFVALEWFMMMLFHGALVLSLLLSISDAFSYFKALKCQKSNCYMSKISLHNLKIYSFVGCQPLPQRLKKKKIGRHPRLDKMGHFVERKLSPSLFMRAQTPYQLQMIIATLKELALISSLPLLSVWLNCVLTDYL